VQANRYRVSQTPDRPGRTAREGKAVSERNTASEAPGCEATQHSDQMVCHRCKSAWDVNDPEPPACTPIEADEELGEVMIEANSQEEAIRLFLEDRKAGNA